jgi:hypothetical protein
MQPSDKLRAQVEAKLKSGLDTPPPVHPAIAER